MDKNKIRRTIIKADLVFIISPRGLASDCEKFHSRNRYQRRFDISEILPAKLTAIHKSAYQMAMKNLKFSAKHEA